MGYPEPMWIDLGDKVGLTGGWGRWFAVEGLVLEGGFGTPLVWVRLGQSEDRFFVADVMAHGLSSRDLRAIPLQRIEAAVNSPGVAKAVLDLEEPDLANDPLELLRSNVATERERNVQAIDDHEAYLATLGLTESVTMLRPTPGVRGTDEFYRTVGSLYMQMMAKGPHPAAAVAALLGEPETTVQHWIKEARRRGLAPRGRRKRQDP